MPQKETRPHKASLRNFMLLMKAKRFIVKGNVQGVGYRYFAARAAQKLGLKGYVKNLINGDVEAYAEGDEKSLEAFHADLLKGPMMSNVNDVIASEEKLIIAFKSFEIKH